MSFISSFEIIKLVVQNHVFSFEFLQQFAESATVIPNEAKIFFANEAATFINGPTNLLNNETKNPPD